jgi:propanediol dehydratase large subunit
MKILKAALFFTLLITCLSSCRLLNSTGGSFVTATVGGEDFESLNLLTSYLEVDSALVTITGSTGGINSQTILFTLADFEGLGEYELGGNSLNIATYADGVGSLEAYSTVNDPGTGILELTALSETVAQGVFSFTASREDENGDVVTIEVTDGEFGIER